jgi:hypothetical protein
VETELDGAGQALSDDLFRHGIICEPVVQAYKWKPATYHDKIAFLKYDGSVSGGELVFDLLDLTNPSHAAAMMRAHERLRDLEKGGDIAYNPNCGGHIHMDATGYGYWDLVRLMTVFGFCEEPIFRLAGAGKTYGHRTLYAGYDRANGGAGYSDPISKGPFDNAQAAWQTISTQKRMSGLNTTIYLAQKDANGYSHGGSSCNGRCKGAMEFIAPKRNANGEITTRGVYDKKTCTCPKQKNTIEWRVWNAQGNPRILYAWIALMQAMHAYAWRPAKHAKYKKHDPMPAFTWTWRPFTKLTQDERRLAQDRVQFMFHELPLTAEEKDALRYAFMRTPYKVFGKDWMRQQADTAYRPPEFPNEYTRPFKRKLGHTPEGKPWADDSGVDYGVPEEIPFEPFEGENDAGVFTNEILRGMRENETPPPMDGQRPRAVDYSPREIYRYWHQNRLQGWDIQEGVQMEATGGTRYVWGPNPNDPGRMTWLPGGGVAPRRRPTPRFGNADNR